MHLLHWNAAPEDQQRTSMNTVLVVIVCCLLSFLLPLLF
jgi:hypothetical protein